MTRVERMLHRLADRVEALEAARPKPRKRKSAPKPDSAIVTKRLKLWSRLSLLHLELRHSRLTKLRFAVRHHLGDPSDFRRFFSAAGRGIPEGSTPAERYYAAMKEALAELEALRVAHGQDSHGIHAGSQSFGARVQ